MQPTFSFVIPIYNSEQYLRECIDSILKQTCQDFEIVLVNDGSSDSSPVICDEYAEKAEKIRVIHKQNGGIVSARNAGIHSAKGKYICYVDSDDTIARNYLDTLLKSVLEYNEPDIIVFNSVFCYDTWQEKQIFPVKPGYYGKEKLIKDIYPYMMYDKRQRFCTPLLCPTPWCKIYKRTLLLEHYCRDERIRQREEQGFVYECFCYAESIYFCPEILYYYNVCNKDSIMSNYDSNYFKNNQYLYEYLKENLEGRFESFEEQLNACRLNWLIIAIYHEIRFNRKFTESVAHIRKSIHETKALKGIHARGIPFYAKAFLFILKLKLYYIALIMAKLQLYISQPPEKRTISH